MKRTMRVTDLVLLAGAALAVMTAPAQAAWHGYISHPLGFAFAAPGELKVEKGTYSGAVAGRHDTLIYRFVDDDIEYKVVVIDVTAQANQAATLLGEAEYLFQDQFRTSTARTAPTSSGPMKIWLPWPLWLHPRSHGRQGWPVCQACGKVISSASAGVL